LGQEEAIPFSNSLAVSDYLRIEQADYHNRDKYRFGKSSHSFSLNLDGKFSLKVVLFWLKYILVHRQQRQ
jgi:hypothetical protein